MPHRKVGPFQRKTPSVLIIIKRTSKLVFVGIFDNFAANVFHDKIWQQSAGVHLKLTEGFTFTQAR